jgi:hypothetical protein
MEEQERGNWDNRISGEATCPECKASVTWELQVSDMKRLMGVTLTFCCPKCELSWQTSIFAVQPERP